MSTPVSQRRDPRDVALDDLVEFYEALTPQSIPRLDDLYARDARFRDPFNDVTGTAAIERIFHHMFAQVDVPRFVVTRRLRDGEQAMLGWRFDFDTAGRHIEVQGVSHLVLDDTGRVLSHCDYWDAAGELYAKLPGIGVLMRWLRRRLSAG